MLSQMSMSLANLQHGMSLQTDTPGWRKGLVLNIQSIPRITQDNSIPLYQVVPSASKIEANNLNKFELNLDHLGGKLIGK